MFWRGSKSRSRLPWNAASFPSNRVLFLRPYSSYQQQKRRATFPSSKQRNLPICVPLRQSVRWSHVSALRRANSTTHSKVDYQSSHSTHPSKPSPPWLGHQPPQFHQSAIGQHLLDNAQCALHYNQDKFFNLARARTPFISPPWKRLS